MKRSLICWSVFLVIFILSMSVIVFADVGPKPTLNIYVKNYISKDYYLDVLVQDGNTKYDNLNRNYSEDYKELELYKYNKDGWLAENIRDFLLFGNLKGKYDESKNMMVHRFGYHGVPHIFKIIIQDTDGKLFVSDVITTKQFNANVILDRETGKAEVVRGSYIGFMGNTATVVRTVLVSMLLTVFIELLIAIPYKIRPFRVIVWVNVVTQIFLHFELLTLFYLRAYSIINSAFLATEVVILFVEYIYYKKYIKNVEKRRLISYVVVANLATFIFGLIVQI